MFKHLVIGTVISCASFITAVYVFDINNFEYLAAIYSLPLIIYLSVYSVIKNGSIKKWFKEFF